MNSPDATLIRFGWNEEWSAKVERAATAGQPGRVTRTGRLLVVQTARGEVLAESPSDVLVRPVCGDWVMVEAYEGYHDLNQRGRICCTLTRRNAVERQAVGVQGPQALVANVDDIWLVCGLDNSQGIRSLPRYQALCRLDNVTLTVVLNKADVAEDVEQCVAEARARAPGLRIVTLCAWMSEGISDLEATLHDGQTLALLGPSGSGKSTLVNALTGGDGQRTHPVRESDHRGRHTTSTSQLSITRSGALVVDMPGLRELGPWQADAFDNSFSDILELARGCRFRDCKHDREPGCHVRSTLEQGLLTSERFLAYLELSRERDARAKLMKGRKRRYPQG